MNQKTYDQLNDKEKFLFSTDVIARCNKELNELKGYKKDDYFDCENPLLALTLTTCIEEHIKRRDALHIILSKEVQEEEDKFCKDTHYRGADYGLA